MNPGPSLTLILSQHIIAQYFLKKIKLQKNYQKTWEPIPVFDSTKN